ncbi:MAG TPA: hypothetical protein VLG44_07075 [Chlamydiales bacterium]|nr:hypothetical protein [Chlamydiales bacterium]
MASTITDREVFISNVYSFALDDSNAKIKADISNAIQTYDRTAWPSGVMREVGTLLRDHGFIPPVGAGRTVTRSPSPVAVPVSGAASSVLRQRREPEEKEGRGREPVVSARDTFSGQTRAQEGKRSEGKRSEVVQKAEKVQSLYDKTIASIKEHFSELGEAYKIFAVASVGYFIGSVMLDHAAAGLIGAVALAVLFDNN